MLIGFLLAIMGGGTLLWWWNTTSRIRASASWPTASGWVYSSSLGRDSTRIRGGSYDILHVADVKYRYSVGGKAYESNTFTFGVPHSYTNQSDAVAELAKYPIGRAVEVRYDPADPATSSLMPGVVPEQFTLLAWMSGAFLLAGLILFGAGLARRLS